MGRRKGSVAHSRPCIACDDGTMISISTRVNNLGRKDYNKYRRYKCKSCNFMTTTYEIEQEHYEELTNRNSKYNHLSKEEKNLLNKGKRTEGYFADLYQKTKGELDSIKHQLSMTSLEVGTLKRRLRRANSKLEENGMRKQ